MYQSSNYFKYTNKNIIQRLLIKNFLNKVSEIIEEIDVQNILDAGCGEGFITRLILDKKPNLKITGLDINKNVFEKFKEKAPEAKFILGDICDLPFPNNQFDLIIALEVLEHVKDFEKAISELKRVTKKYCLISVPYEPYFRIGNFLREKNFKLLGADPDHCNFWNKKIFSNLINNYFKILKIKTPFPWIIILGSK